MNKWYQLSVNHVANKLRVNINHGLSSSEITQRKKSFGENALQMEKKSPKIILFLKQFQDFMVLILLAATLIAGMLGEYIDAIAIMLIVLLNGCIGFFQEFKAEKSLEKLKELASPVANVLRDGVWVKIPSQDVVVGDVIKISRGDRIPADIRIIQSNSLETEESPLTGESLPVEKSADKLNQSELEAQDQSNMGFKGTMVTRGHGLGIVVSVGMQTEMGHIASLMAKTRRVITPLERRLAELGKVLILVALSLTILVVVIGIYQGHPTYQMFLAGVSLAVAVIPEGLPAIVTVALSLGVQRMIRKKAIIRQLSAVETLGTASVICSDKTGTMTENKMTVKELYVNNQLLSVTGDGYHLKGHFYLNDKKLANDYPNLKMMLHYGMVCNHASIIDKGGHSIIEGDPTDGALLVAARKLGLDESNRHQLKIIKEIPFDSERKRMSVVVEDHNQMRFLIVKGAPDVLLSRFSYYVTESGRQSLTNKVKLDIEGAVNHMANQALRTLAIGFKPLKKDDDLDDFLLENDLTFIGLYGMIDPPRKEVKNAILACKQAGIKTVMITGDHVKTARAIAEQLQLLPENGLVLEGYELNRLSFDELKEMIEDVYVFARVTPEHKLKIVKAFQEKGHVVAMTGDGVNDAPAIKASNIGISMGISGTDVTKEASSLILMDDNFATIKKAIEEGRNIYDNIRKFVRYLLSSNVGEILVMLFALMMAMPLPLIPVQILWVNLVTDGLPALALGLDQPEENVMKRGPRNPRESIFAGGLGYKILSRGFLIGLVTLVAFIIVFQKNDALLEHARTVAFATLVMAQLIHVFDCRSDSSVFSRNPFENRYLIIAVLSSLFLLLIVIYWAPLQPIFQTTYLFFHDWLLIIGLSMIPTIIFGFSKK
ncbi:MAG TPA: cation-translocating P-type ATPase [Cerasibacillus sp.]|uniref:cation-translocating P-type ATPase n=1 Tax=Cerasibacillus sp. TaxID=2498711 RepID=UPI002F3F98E9